MRRATMTLAIVAANALIFLCSTVAFADQKTFTAERKFCSVEFRAGNNGVAANNPEVGRQAMSVGQEFSYDATFLFAHRESNPGVCGSPPGLWQRCSWDTCTLH